MTVCLINGVSVPWAEASVPVMDRGFLYGDSVFEVLRSYSRRAFALDAHLRRLAVGCRALGMAVPADAALREDVARALEAGPADAFVRIIVTRGSSVRGIHDDAAAPTRIVVAQPLPPSLDPLRAAGVRAVTVAYGGALDYTPARGIKAGNYLPNILALRAAAEQGAYEAILTGPGGEVREGATSNLFVLLDGTLTTPPAALGLLPGITREWVMRAGRTVLPVEERLLFPCDLYRAEEVWITSSVREMLPVVQLDGRPVGAGGVGPRFAEVFAAFREEVERLMVDASVPAG